jgi:hypothetical protein
MEIGPVIFLKSLLALTLEEKAGHELHFTRFPLFLPDFYKADEILDYPFFVIPPEIRNNTGYIQRQATELHPGEGGLFE